MIAGLVGTIRQVESDALVVDVQGVLYRVYVPTSLIQDESSGIGTLLQLNTHLVVREDSLTLFGFIEQGEVAWFRVLLGINGVGPRVALAMMSRFSVEELVSVVHGEDVAALSSVPGIGRKTASRILLDLRGKIPAEAEGVATAKASILDEELIEALQGLGYSRVEAMDASSKVDLAREDELEERLLSALRSLSPSG